MMARHLVLPQFHNSGPNLPLLNVAVLRTSCRQKGITLSPVDYRFSAGIKHLSPTVRMNYRRHVGEIMDLPLICSVVDAYRRGEDLVDWRIPPAVVSNYILNSGLDSPDVRAEVDGLYCCGIRAAEENRDAEIVTMTAYVTNLLTIVACALRLRQLGDTRILIGGPSVTQSGPTRRLLFLSTAADILVCGDGEGRIAEAIQTLAGGSAPVPSGVLRAEDDGGSGAIPLPCTNWRDSPMPDLDYLDWEPYQPFAVTVEASRGCPARCTFCSEHGLHGHLQARRPGDVARYLDELRGHYRINRAYFVDSTFNFSPKWLDTFSAEMIGRHEAGRGYFWACQLRADAGTCDAKQLYRAGLRGCNVGVESFDPDVLAGMRKRTDPLLAYEFVRDLLASRVDVSVNIVTGFPGETREGFLRTHSEVARLVEWSISHSLLNRLNINLSSFHVCPGIRGLR